MKQNYGNYHIVFFSILISLWIVGCIDLPTDLKAPQWDVDLNVPIVNKTYTLNDIIKKQNYISIQGTSSADSIYVIQSNTYSQGTDVAKFVQVTTQTSSPGNIIPVSSLIDTSVTIYLPIPEGAILQKAVFTSGVLKFQVHNPTLVTAYINMTLPGISKDGNQLTIHLTALPGDNSLMEYPLAGYNYTLPQNQQTVNQDKIQFIIGSSYPNGSILAFLTMDLYSSDFYFSSVTGYLPTKDLGAISNSFSLNLGQATNYRDKVSLKNGNLSLNINYISANSNPFGFELKNVNIIGKREDGTKIYLTDNTDGQNLTFKLNNGSYSHQFTQDNSNINSFISFIPSSVVLNAEYIMNPDGTTGTVAVADSIKFSSSFSSTSALAFQKSVITDTAGIDISDQDSKKIKDAKSAYINVSVQNGIPLDTWLTITLVDTLFKPLFTLKNSGSSDSSFSFSAASVNTSGEVTGLVSSNLLIQLDSTQTEMLSRARHVIYSATLQSNTGAQYVTVRPNDVLKVSVYGGVKYHVNTDDLK
ncbi:MAG: hypothetical protein P4L45_07480 [Ignavibacteriaceae bacterium]|nr:hypothetical protein [Ignavibacteriaceae bacterium]